MLLAPIWMYKQNFSFLAYPEDTFPGGIRSSILYPQVIIELTQLKLSLAKDECIYCNTIKLNVGDSMCSVQSMIKTRTTPEVQIENLCEDW